MGQFNFRFWIDDFRLNFNSLIQNRSTERLALSVPLRGSKLRAASPRVAERSRTPTGKQATRSVPQESLKSKILTPLPPSPSIVDYDRLLGVQFFLHQFVSQLRISTFGCFFQNLSDKEAFEVGVTVAILF